jgi:hypothetical protein
MALALALAFLLGTLDLAVELRVLLMGPAAISNAGW